MVIAVTTRHSLMTLVVPHDNDKQLVTGMSFLPCLTQIDIWNGEVCFLFAIGLLQGRPTADHRGHPCAHTIGHKPLKMNTYNRIIMILTPLCSRHKIVHYNIHILNCCAIELVVAIKFRVCFQNTKPSRHIYTEFKTFTSTCCEK